MSFARCACVLAFALATACQGEYPIPATDCDRWCDVTQGVGRGCGFYDPAQCVADCEEEGFTHEEACHELFDSALACFRSNPGAAATQCSFDEVIARPCQAEAQALYDCTNNVPTAPPRR
jgi:hypothetical protein